MSWMVLFEASVSTTPQFRDLTYFPQPIVYPEPTGYGSNAAIWMFGLGILLPPMSPGLHIIDMQVVSPLTPVFGVDLGYYNTWYVTVVRP